MPDVRGPQPIPYTDDDGLRAYRWSIADLPRGSCPSPIALIVAFLCGLVVGIYAGVSW
jgi:hypothetical protein